jgi:hypothetical protein
MAMQQQRGTPDQSRTGVDGSDFPDWLEARIPNGARAADLAFLSPGSRPTGR